MEAIKILQIPSFVFGRTFFFNPLAVVEHLMTAVLLREHMRPLHDLDINMFPHRKVALPHKIQYICSQKHHSCLN